MAKTKKAPAPAAAKPRADMNGWVLCPGDGVLIISPGEEYHGLFAKVDTFPTTLELSSYVQIDGRPTTVGRVLIPNAQLRWSGPGLDQLDQLRPTRPGQRVRVVLDNESLATAEMKALDGQLGEVTALGPVSSNNVSMITVKFDDASLLPASVYNYDLLIVPTPVVQYVPEPEAVAPKGNTFDTLQAGLAAHKAGLHVVPLASIVVTTNTRKVFDETALAELAESVKAHGILQPIVLRPHTEAGQYELVAGGRRYRAAQLAGLAEVPATVRNLTDREFLEVQLLENLQRVDVRPADEATAFAKLLNNNFSAEEIGLKVGKPVKFVLQRAKLVTLIPFWLELLEADRLPLVAAHELARLPAHSQVVVKKWMESCRGYELKKNELLSASDIRHAINQEVLRKLDLVTFPKEDITLCPSAGACTTCPKNSANSRGLFDDLTESSRQAICLDASCFSQKKEAFIKRRIREVEQQLAGLPVLIADETQTRKQYSTAIYAYQFYSGKEGNPGVVQGLKLDGTEAGQLVWGVLSTSAQSQLGKDSEEKKVQDAARIRKERTRKTHRTMLAEALTADLPTAIEDESAAAHAALDYFILEELSGKASAKVDYLKSALGWEPTEAALKDDYNTHDALGFRPWKSWLVGKLDELDFTEKLRLFFILKVRHRMDHEYEDLQFNIAKLAGETYDHVAGEAEQAVEARYYTKKGKKQEATA